MFTNQELEQIRDIVKEELQDFSDEQEKRLDELVDTIEDLLVAYQEK